MDKNISFTLAGQVLAILIFINLGLPIYFAYLAILLGLVVFSQIKLNPFIFLGATLLLFYLLFCYKDYQYELQDNISIVGEVTKAYKKYENYQRIEVETKDKGKFSVATLGETEFQLYDVVTGNITIEDEGGNYNFNLPNRKQYFFLKNIDSNSKSTNLVRSKNPSVIKNFKLKAITDINNIIDEYFSKENREIVRKLILNSSDSNDTIIELYRDAGLAHLIAISGLHIFIIIGMLNFILLLVSVNYNLRFILISTILFIYGFILDYPPAISRALVMYFLINIGEINKLKISPKSIILVSGILLLTIHPKWLYDLGFQLSFMSVLGISIIKERALEKEKSALLKYFYIYVSVNLFIFPLLIYNFNSFNPLSLVTNFFMTPIITFSLLGIYVGLFLELLFGIGGLIFNFIDFIIMGGSFYLEQVVNLTNFRLRIHNPNIYFIVIYYGILFLYINKTFNKITYKSKKIVMVSAYLIFIFSLFNNGYGTLFLGFLDVGQGDSAYLIYKDKYIQIDTGGSTYSSYNPGEEVTVNSIIKRGIGKVDLFMISHFDLDHIGGTEKLLDDNLIENVIINRPEYGDLIFEKLKSSNINIYYPTGEDSLIIDNNLKIDFFNVNPPNHIESNDSSLIALITYKDKKILFTGDASSEVEDKYSKDIGNIDILKVSHHGSKYSTSEKFAYNVQPKISVISCGRNNPYGHPAPEVIENLEKVNSTIIRTDIEGEVLFKINEKINYTTYFNQGGTLIENKVLVFSVIMIIVSLIQIKKNEELYEIRRF